MQLTLVGGRVVLEESWDFRSFKVVIQDAATDADLVRAFAGFARFQGTGVAWVSQQALRSWPGVAQDASWQQGLARMIEKARPYGWIDDEQGAIRGHVVRVQEACK